MTLLRTDATLQETVREAVIQARRGQGLFKQRVMRIERPCRISGVNQASLLGRTATLPDIPPRERAAEVAFLERS